MRRMISWIAVFGLVVIINGCASSGSTANTKQGAVLGGVLGAAAGGVIGHQSGRGLEGAAIGAGAGALGGGLVGSAKDEEQSTSDY